MTRRLGLSVPLGEVPLSRQAALFAEAEELGYTDFWSPETETFDAFAPLVLAASCTERVRLGTAIANVFTRGPSLLAMSSAAVAELAPGRFALGLGVSTPTVVEDWNGRGFEAPVDRVRETAAFLREAWSGRRVDFSGQTFSVRGFRLSRPPSPEPALFIAALRPRMLRLAGQIADGVIINWVGADDIKRMASIVRSAAEESGRDPSAVEIVCVLPAFVVDRPADADEAARRLIAGYMPIPSYEGFQRWLGRADMIAPLVEAWRAGDRAGAVRRVPHQMLDDLLLIGDADDCIAKLEPFHAAGVTVPVLALMGTRDGAEARAQQRIEAMRELAEALAQSTGAARQGPINEDTEVAPKG